MLVNLTSSSHGVHSHTLKVGQHRWIYKDSDVNFGDAFQTTDTALENEVSCGNAVPHDDMDRHLVSGIIERAKTHPAFPRILRRLLPA